MERIFDGYSFACQEAILESRKQKDKLFYVFNKHIDGVKYALTDNKESTGSLLQTYQNGMIYIPVPAQSQEPKYFVDETKKVEAKVSEEKITPIKEEAK